MDKKRAESATVCLNGIKKVDLLLFSIIYGTMEPSLCLRGSVLDVFDLKGVIFLVSTELSKNTVNVVPEETSVFKPHVVLTLRAPRWSFDVKHDVTPEQVLARSLRSLSKTD